MMMGGQGTHATPRAPPVRVLSETTSPSSSLRPRRVLHRKEHHIHVCAVRYAHKSSSARASTLLLLAPFPWIVAAQSQFPLPLLLSPLPSTVPSTLLLASAPSPTSSLPLRATISRVSLLSSDPLPLLLPTMTTSSSFPLLSLPKLSSPVSPFACTSTSRSSTSTLSSTFTSSLQAPYCLRSRRVYDQMRARMSPEPVANSPPVWVGTGEGATEMTEFLWPCSMSCVCPVRGSQN